jgi:hypothetical protein
MGDESGTAGDEICLGDNKVMGPTTRCPLFMDAGAPFAGDSLSNLLFARACFYDLQPLAEFAHSARLRELCND